MTRLGTLAVVIATVAAIAAPFFLKPYGIFLISTWAVLTIAAIGLNLTLGYAGQISLAQGAFVGIGAYTVALLTPLGVPFFLAFLAAGFLCFAVGWGLGYPALRVQHHYLAFVTLAFTTLVFLVLRNEQWLTNGIYGITGTPRPTILGWSTNGARDFYFFCLGILALLSFATWWMLRSPWGRAFVALRENPLRALSLGLDTRRYTLMAFAIGSSLGGLAGGLYAPLVQFIEPNSFALGLSFNLLLMVIVGGSGNFFGPFVGALVAVLLPEWLRITQGYYLIIYAAAIMVMMAFCPSGLLGLVERATKALNGRRAVATTAGAHGRCRTMTAVLEVSNLRKAFGGIVAVDDVSFEVHAGEILGIIGPNGSGKSTLFNCVLGQLQPSAGEVRVDGQVTTGARPCDLNRLGVSRTFQLLQVFPQLSVRDNLILAGQEHQGTMASRLFGRADAGLGDAAAQMIEFFRLSHLAEEQAGSLSYGQQKLLDAAMAFMAGPRLVLLDEPAGGVNLTMLGHLRERLQAYHTERKATFVVIEHQMEFVMALCTRVLVLAEGRLIAEGAPDEIRRNPIVIEAYLGH